MIHWQRASWHCFFECLNYLLEPKIWCHLQLFSLQRDCKMKTTKTADSFSNPMSCQCLNRNVTPQIQELRKAPRRSSRHCALCIFHEQHITSPSPSRQTSDMDFKSIHLAPNPCRYQVQVVIISRLDHCKRSLNPSSCFILLCQTQGSLGLRAGDGVFTSLSGLR